jgi:hypothetical protein
MVFVSSAPRYGFDATVSKATRRKIARITLLHKAFHEKVAIPIPSYIIKPTRTSRFHHPKRYIHIRPKKDVYNMTKLLVYTVKSQKCVYLQVIKIRIKSSYFVHVVQPP